MEEGEGVEEGEEGEGVEGKVAVVVVTDLHWIGRVSGH